MSRILAVIAKDARGRHIEGLLRSSHPDVPLEVVHGWRGLVAGFGDVYPRALLIDVRFAADGGPGQVRSVRRSAPWLPILVLGDLDGLSAEAAIELVQAGVTEFVAPGEFDASERLRAAVRGDGQLLGRVLEALRRRYGPQPLPAELTQVLEVALERRPSGRLKVEGLAGELGQSRANLERGLKRWGAPPPGRVLRWCLVLWAVHDLTTEPGATAESVAFELGCSSAGALGNAMFRCLGGRTKVARAMGLEGAIARFVGEFAVRSGRDGGAERQGLRENVQNVMRIVLLRWGGGGYGGQERAARPFLCWCVRTNPGRGEDRCEEGGPNSAVQCVEKPPVERGGPGSSRGCSSSPSSSEASAVRSTQCRLSPPMPP